MFVKTYFEVCLQQRIDAAIGEIENTSAYIGRAEFRLPGLPCYGELYAGVMPQPYHVELWAEKSTMNDILLPLAQRELEGNVGVAGLRVHVVVGK